VFTVTTKSFAGLTAGHYQCSTVLTPIPGVDGVQHSRQRSTNGLGGDVELTVTCRGLTCAPASFF